MAKAGGNPDQASTRPYLLRAIYQWALDFGMTPQVLVDAGAEGVVVPDNFVNNGRIALTIHPRSVKDLEMGNEFLSFSARFAGKLHSVQVPVSAVLAIYGRENGRGFYFQDKIETPPPGEPDPQTPPPARKKPGAPRLKLIK